MYTHVRAIDDTLKSHRLVQPNSHLIRNDEHVVVDRCQESSYVLAATCKGKAGERRIDQQNECWTPSYDDGCWNLVGFWNWNRVETRSRSMMETPDSGFVELQKAMHIRCLLVDVTADLRCFLLDIGIGIVASSDVYHSQVESLRPRKSSGVQSLATNLPRYCRMTAAQH